MSSDSPESGRASFTLSGETPLSTRLMREHPAADEGPSHAWELARQVIDHAAWFLDRFSTMDQDRAIRSVVLAALLRRAVITGEGVRIALYHSLEEPAIVLLRNLLEAELNLRLVAADETDKMAKRLAANHYLRAKKHITSALKHPEVQAGDEEFKEFMKEAGKRQKEFYKRTAFDEIRDDLSSDRNWHGYDSMREAFEAVGGSTDYLHLYDSFSPFVHVSNLDHDFDGIVYGETHMRALVQRDPVRVQHYLKGLVFILLRFIDVYLEEKGADDYLLSWTLTHEDGEENKLTPFDALRQQAIAVFGEAEGWVVVDADPPSNV